MRTVDLKTVHSPQGQPGRTARLVRHLAARLQDFGPGGPEVLAADQTAGLVSARFPGHDTGAVLQQLERCGVFALQESDRAVFRLSPGVRFEDLDYVWGCLFGIL